MGLKRLKLHQIAPICRWYSKKFFLHPSIWNYTIFVKNGAVLHHLATLFDNTIRSKPEQGDHIVCILPNIYEILQNSLPNYK